APLWQVPLPNAGAHTGMSDYLAPGDIAQLSQSDALAFRVVFDGAIPPQRDLYWRGLVLNIFDGHTWRTSEINDSPLQATQRSTQQESNVPIAYEVFLEPTYQRWLYALSVPEPIASTTVLTVDYRLRAHDIITEKFAYRALAYPRAQFGMQLNQHERKYELD